MAESYRPATLTLAQENLLDSLGLLGWWHADQLLFARDLEGAVWVVAEQLVGPSSTDIRDVFSGDTTLAQWWAAVTA